nr:hypothetical protein [Bacillaceae bacterium]
MEIRSAFPFYRQKEVHTETAPFRNGQLVFGRVLKLLPDGRALVRIGKEAFWAKAEAPLVAHRDYLFEISAEKGSVRLKIAEQDAEGGLSRLLSAPNGDVLRRLIQFFRESGLPFDREVFRKGEAWLKAVPDIGLGMQTIKVMAQNRLPFTDEMFHGLYSFHGKESLSGLISRFFELLEKETGTIGPRWQSLMDRFPIRREQPLLALFARWLDPAVPEEESRAAFRLLSAVFPGWADKGEEQLLREAAEKLGFPGEGTRRDFRSVLFAGWRDSRIHGDDPFSFLSRVFSDRSLDIRAPADGQNLVSRFPEMFGKAEGEAWRRFAGDHPLLFTDWTKGDEVLKAFQWIIRTVRGDGEAGGETASFRRELEVLLENRNLSPKLRLSAEKLFSRIAAEEHLFAERDGMFQGVTEIPLFFQGEKADLVIRWFGKKRGEKLDEDYCRVVFDLTMPHLGDLCVFVTVQNRIVSLTFYSGFDRLEESVGPGLPALREGLKKIDYTLGTVKFQKPHEPSGSLPEEPIFRESRVDIKI